MVLLQLNATIIRAVGVHVIFFFPHLLTYSYFSRLVVYPTLIVYFKRNVAKKKLAESEGKVRATPMNNPTYFVWENKNQS